ncbi:MULTISPECIES: UTP--glucose-1-phosphate uridylyltransferase [unclassified Caulobacter]|uniref:UTP--glucose-1-phosphate uridylyltransferase n=1 Tax=unclassified Caulobacter TaxID=2648921 RepID=UPI000D33291B|nr:MULTISPECIES: UTP--glucose-1-phosphate uridylyltransferase [unclassified Caulobacter]PTS84747.1 UTP--glucose-1-phosphate uridylyltransferase [Caulobacter sp. HMWF009]PTT05905.1 UTP--glucose-1-phosphate uridylyltransferase [Caulobacter sp. HMWF025]PTT80059.1 UTP--glucose-1-phosphate uridylyltransferase [Pseudomonas sp. HMWF010]
MKPVRKAVLPVAGLGTRVLPGTKTTPKELLNVVDRPILSYVVEEGRKAGIEHFVFVTGRGKGAIEDYFDHQIELEAQLEAKGKLDILAQLRAELPKPGEMSFVRQMAPLGLGHAVWCARDIIGDEPFAVMLPDVIIDAERSALGQLVDAYNKVGGGNLVGVEEVPEADTHKYGIVAPSKVDGRLATMSGMVEKPAKGTAPSNWSIAGRYILQPEIFGLLAEQEKGAGNEIQLTDSMAKLLHLQPFHAYIYEGVTHDCGDKIGLLRANVALALKRPDLGEAARAAISALL